MAKFEAQMGTIKLPEGSEGMPPFPINFGGKVAKPNLFSHENSCSFSIGICFCACLVQ